MLCRPNYGAFLLLCLYYMSSRLKKFDAFAMMRVSVGPACANQHTIAFSWPPAATKWLFVTV